MLSEDVTKRVVAEDGDLHDYNLRTSKWEVVPKFDVFVAGFPCTPWSRWTSVGVFLFFSDSLASTSDTALSLIKKPALHQER